jgi:Flp pilus assembly protein TadG
MRWRQRGITLLVVTIALFSLLLIGGLALDIGHVMVNKARLQASVDAAALSAAKVLDVTSSTGQATTAANNVFQLNAQNHSDLWSVFGSVTLTVDYSNTLVPFAAGTTPSLYVRVRATGFSVAATLASVAGINNFTLAASAVAGPSPTINTACNIVPILMCGTASTSSAPIFGYSSGEIMVLKYAGGGGGQNVGPGNYMLLNVGSGAAAVRQQLAGSYASCATTNNGTVQTETGVAAGPVAQGLNTRFNEYSGPLSGLQSTYPPDEVTTQPSGSNRLSCSNKSCTTVVAGSPSQTITNSSQYTSWSYEGMYQPKLQSQSYDVAPPTGVPDRRVLAVPIGDCTTAGHGTSTLNVMGLACVFLLQDVDQSDSNVFGEVLSNCQVNGTPGPAPSSGPGPYIIQLYHVDGSPES